MTTKEMKNIFAMEIPLESIEVDSGIYEFYEEKDKSIGISYENIEDRYVYIFNLFINGEYINIDGEYKCIYDAIENITKIWNKY